MIELRYDTWGTRGQFTLVSLILPDGTRIHPLEVTPKFRGTVMKITKKFGKWMVTVEGENNDSNKNRHRVAKILTIDPEPEFVVIKNEYQTAKNYDVTYEVVNLSTGEKFEPEVEEVVEEAIKENDKYIYKMEITKTYVVFKNRKVLVDEEEKVLEKKPKVLTVHVGVFGRLIMVTGDTYHIREILKSNGFKWNRVAWVKLGNGDKNKDIEETVRLIKSYEARVGIPIIIK